MSEKRDHSKLIVPVAAVAGIGIGGYLLYRMFKGFGEAVKVLDPREQAKAASDREAGGQRAGARKHVEQMKDAIRRGDRNAAYKHYVAAKGDYMAAEQRFHEANRSSEAEKMKIEQQYLKNDFLAAYSEPELVKRAYKEAKARQTVKTYKPSWLPLQTIPVPKIGKPPKAKKKLGDYKVSGFFNGGGVAGGPITSETLHLLPRATRENIIAPRVQSVWTTQPHSAQVLVDARRGRPVGPKNIEMRLRGGVAGGRL